MNLPSGNILKYYIWSFISGFYFLYTLQGIYPLSKGITVPQLALYVSATSILTTLFEIPTGFVADKWSRKLSVSLGELLGGIGYIGFFFIWDFYSLLPIALIFALSSAFASGAKESLIYDELKRQGQEEAYLKVTSRGTLIGTVSGAVATFTGPILFTVSPIIPFLLSGLASIFLSAFVLTFNESKVSGEVSKHVRILDGVKNILRNRPLTLIAAIQTLIMVFVMMYYQVLFFPKINGLGLDIEYLGALDVVTLGITSLLLFLLPRFVFRRDVVNLTFYTLLAVLAFVLFSNVYQLIPALIFGVAFDSAWTLRNHIIPTITNKFLESRDRALSLSSMSFISNFGAALLLPIASLAFNISYVYTAVPAAVIIILLLACRRASFDDRAEFAAAKSLGKSEGI